MMRHDEPATMMHLIRPLLLLLAVLALLFLAEQAAGDSVRIHDVTGSGGPDIVLSQVAELEGDYANRFAGVVVGRFSDGASKAEVEASAVIRAMRDGGAKLGMIDLKGFARCTVHRTYSEPEQAESEDSEPAVANVDTRAGTEPVTIHTPTTVRALIEQAVVQRTGLDRSDLAMTFAEQDEELLRGSAVAGRYEIEPVTEPALGPVSFKVYEYQGTRRVGGGQLVTVKVARRVIAVIATESIPRGTLINRRQVRLREVLIDDAMRAYLTETALVVGQVASQRLEPGDLVTAGEIRLPVAVKRRERVTVELKTPGVKITFNGIAQDEGAVGETIEVENPKTKQRFNATVVGRGKVEAGQDLKQQKEKQ